MKFTSQICTSRSQSERLLALGLKKETADMSISTQSFDTDNGIKYSLIPYSECKYRIMYNIIPAWSLHRLIEIMPTVITYEDYSLILGINATCVYYADDEYAETFKAFEGNLYECVVKCIDWLIKEGYFNREYLED